MGDEEELRQRQEKLIEDRKGQAKWYESLNLYAEAMKIYNDIKDEENIHRLSIKMKNEYGKTAQKLENTTKYQEAANLYYLIGDLDSVARMKKKKPDLVIIYDEEEGGLAQIAKDMMDKTPALEDDRYFEKPNPADEFEVNEDGEEIDPENGDKELTPMGRRGIQVKMPKNMKKMRFCPYCGERVNTKKSPKFCPFCGEELA